MANSEIPAQLGKWLDTLLSGIIKSRFLLLGSQGQLSGMRSLRDPLKSQDSALCKTSGLCPLLHCNRPGLSWETQEEMQKQLTVSFPFSAVIWL